MHACVCACLFMCACVCMCVLYVFLHVCTHVHVCIRECIYVFAYVHVEAQRMVSCTFLNSFLPSFWDRVTHWTWCSPIQLDQLVSKPYGSSCLCLSSVRITLDAVPGFLSGCWGSEFRPLCLHSKHSACWASSLAGLFQFSVHSYLIWGYLLFFMFLIF